MADYPYCTVPGKLSEFLKKIHDIGIPDKVTTRWLPSIGFGSINDRSIIPVLKFVGLVEDSGTPSKVWRDYRGHGAGRALATAIHSSYPELFNTYPDAQSRSPDELKAFFRGHSTYGAQAVGKAVNTFQVLCHNADFSGSASSHSSLPATASETPQADPPPMSISPAVTNIANGPSLHIDIQIHISPEASTDQIEKIFESMSKYLYKNG